ncbi:MAG: GNAT family acetyltransferase [Fusobacterium varium]|uniref:GNAT family N-acetyltransferase n=1 Tax=Fusobacterium varium TaxID=856 RepID=UPI00242AB9AD|nr:GNAT family acetyltransferase [Fusobacterium varium]MDY4005960.1 GNAT family acetyltransferase [Fusobacterium varium]UYI80153.1 MAG: GNAT family acetyltransferase [Fusobacterium varium]
MEIRYAVYNDLDRVLDLLRTNHVDTISEEEKQNGFVTTNITKEQLCNLMETEKGITVAEDGDRIVGFALAGSWNFWQPWPLFTYMIEHLKEFELNGETLTVENSYQYGPVCLDKKYRGTGIFEKLFTFSLKSMADRFPYMVTFINQVNPRSYAAHTRKANMIEAGTFDWNNNHYWLMAIQTK